MLAKEKVTQCAALRYACPNLRFPYKLCLLMKVFQEYMAPEQIRGLGHDHCVDWWGLGVLVYEMATGIGPFAVPEDTSVYDVYELVLHFRPQGLRIEGGPEWEACAHLVQALLVHQSSSRLGCQGNGAGQLKAHPFFHGWQWDAMVHGTLKAPHIPLPLPEPITDATVHRKIDVFEPGFESRLQWEFGASASPTDPPISPPYHPRQPSTILERSLSL